MKLFYTYKVIYYFILNEYNWMVDFMGTSRLSLIILCLIDCLYVWFICRTMFAHYAYLITVPVMYLQILYINQI